MNVINEILNQVQAGNDTVIIRLAKVLKLISSDTLQEVLSGSNEMTDNFPIRENEEFIVYSESNGAERKFKDYKKFLDYIEKLFTKNNYGVDIYKAGQELPEILPGHAEEAKQLIINTINKLRVNPEYVDRLSIEIFNRKEEVVYEVVYTNKVLQTRIDINNFLDNNWRAGESDYTLFNYLIGRLHGDTEDEKLKKNLIDAYSIDKEIVHMLKDPVVY